tara:strand:+ start:182697 stop:184118 length:1422 start_codon:yes stop_codon:yes gene_type:complete
MIDRIFVLAFACLFAAVTAAAEESKPNIVLVMADDQGWGDMAYNSHDVLKTPNFDEAAATGLRFDQFYAAAPVCSPTRASVMTGRTPNRMGVFKWGYPMRPQETTIAEAVKTAGYATAHFGKWHLGSVRNQSPSNPGKNGFDHWLSAPNFYDNDPILSLGGKAVQFQGESSIIAVDAAIDWMKESCESEKPFLAVVWFGSPHHPHLAAEEDRKLYDDQPEKLQHFYGEITGMDRAFGKLRNSLSDLGIRENTILWYCSDNGALPKIGNTGGHRGDKGDVYEGGLLVPAILEWPAKITQPRVTDMRCVTSDIYPTITEITGVEIANQPPLDGISLVPLINQQVSQRPQPIAFWDTDAKGIGTPAAEWMTELLTAQNAGKDLPPHESSLHAADLPNPPHSTEEFPGHAALIDGDWKIHRIQNDKQGIAWELYNLANDKAESVDLIDQESARAGKLKSKLNTWLESVAESLNGNDY